MLLAPPKVVGVQALAPDHMTIRVTARTKPGSQWEVQRLMRIHLKDGLDAEGLYAGAGACAGGQPISPRADQAASSASATSTSLASVARLEHDLANRARFLQVVEREPQGRESLGGVADDDPLDRSAHRALCL